jgi:molybdopterin molybdotransferase
MPGNPMASAVGLNFFLKPYLEEPKKPLLAKLLRDTLKPKGLRAFYQGTLLDEEVDIFQKQASYCMGGFAQANAWVVLPEECDLMPAGSMLEVYPI